MLSSYEYRDITERPEASPINCFTAFVNKMKKAGKRNVVKKFVQALKDEKQHAGHQTLLNVIETKVLGTCMLHMKCHHAVAAIRFFKRGNLI